MLAKYKNIVILEMKFDPDVVTGTVNGEGFKADIQTDSKGQYIIVDEGKYYLEQFKVKGGFYNEM